MKSPATKRLLAFLYGSFRLIILTVAFSVITESSNAQNVITDSISAQSLVKETDNLQNCDPVHRCPLLFTCVNGHCVPVFHGPCNCHMRPRPPACGVMCGPLTEKNERGKGPFSVSIFTNDASASTTISFSLQQPGKITLNIFDLNGNLLKILADEIFEEGEHSIEWGTAEINEGVYLLQIQSTTSSQIEKLTVTK